MRVVEVRASPSILMGLIDEMREWLDQNGATAVRFDVKRGGAVGIVTVPFDTDDHLAERFCKALRGSYID